MGCDIHVCCERKNYKDEWINCDYFKLNPYFDNDDDEDDKWWLVPIFDDRNYELFATLADVRNYGYIKRGRKNFCVYGEKSSLIRSRYV